MNNQLTVKLKDFKRDLDVIFDLSLSEVYDPIMSLVAMFPKLDIIKFDEILHDRHGNYENSKQSMNDIVLKHYGSEGVKFIENHL